MKQTAVEWFAQQLGITSGSMLEQAKQMEEEQMKIPELSDEEIENLCQSKYGAYDEHDEFDNGLREGMKLYREQLKQRQ